MINESIMVIILILVREKEYDKIYYKSSSRVYIYYVIYIMLILKQLLATSF